MSNSLNTMVPIGVRFMVLSAFGFALMSATVKHVSLHGIPVFEIVAARALVSLVISYLDVKRKRISVWGNNKPLLLARGAVGTFALMCVYYSVTTLPLAEATIFQYIHPVFTALLAVIFFERANSAHNLHLYCAMFARRLRHGSARNRRRVCTNTSDVQCNDCYFRCFW